MQPSPLVVLPTLGKGITLTRSVSATSRPPIRVRRKNGFHIYPLLPISSESQFGPRVTGNPPPFRGV